MIVPTLKFMAFLPGSFFMLATGLTIAQKVPFSYYRGNEREGSDCPFRGSLKIRLIMATKAKTATKSDTFAIIETGGKQYMAAVGATLKVEKIKGPLGKEGFAVMKVGDKVVFDKVLLTDNGSDTVVGAPYVKGVTVEAEIKKIARSKKVVVIKYKAKSNHFQKKGHKQPYFEVAITKVA